MTPEERFTKMENLLQAMMEHVSQHQIEIDKHTEEIKQHTVQIEKQNAGIRDLVIVSRTLLTSIQESREQHDRDLKKLRDAQAVTEEKLRALIDTVDRIIRNRNGKQ